MLFSYFAIFAFFAANNPRVPEYFRARLMSRLADLDASHS
jgi:hypothetical protein